MACNISIEEYDACKKGRKGASGRLAATSASWSLGMGRRALQGRNATQTWSDKCNIFRCTCWTPSLDGAELVRSALQGELDFHKRMQRKKRVRAVEFRLRLYQSTATETCLRSTKRQQKKKTQETPPVPSEIRSKANSQSEVRELLRGSELWDGHLMKDRAERGEQTNEEVERAGARLVERTATDEGRKI